MVTTHEGSNRFQSPTTETTAGSLYAYGRQLYVILSQYRYNPMRTNLNCADISYRSQEPLDYSGLRYRTLRFTPKAALRADSPNPPTMEKSTDRFVAVDYQLLEQAWRNLATTRQAAPQVGGGAAPVGESLEATRAAEAQARPQRPWLRKWKPSRRNWNPFKNNSATRPPDKTAQSRKPHRSRMKAVEASDGSKASAF